MDYNYLKQVLLGVDQLFNTLLGGWADETLSSRCYRLYRDGKNVVFMKVIDTLFFFQPKHCEESYKSEVERLQLPPEFRSK